MTEILLKLSTRPQPFAPYVRERLDGVLKDEDLSQYIL